MQVQPEHPERIHLAANGNIPEGFSNSSGKLRKARTISAWNVATRRGTSFQGRVSQTRNGMFLSTSTPCCQMTCTSSVTAANGPSPSVLQQRRERLKDTPHSDGFQRVQYDGIIRKSLSKVHPVQKHHRDSRVQARMRVHVLARCVRFAWMIKYTVPRLPLLRMDDWRSISPTTLGRSRCCRLQSYK